MDETGAAISRSEYLPYGESWVQTGDKGYSPKYNGQELDGESEFYYYNARHYDPQIGRFISADTVVDGATTSAGWNRYMYVHGNPVMYKDPSGHFSAETDSSGSVTGGKVESGDTLTAIATDYLKGEGYNPTKEVLNHAVDLLAKGNKISNPDKISVGQTIDFTSFKKDTKGASGETNEALSPIDLIGGGIGVKNFKNIISKTGTKKVIEDTAQGAEKSLYRNMSKAEADAVKESGLLRGGREGETYWTDSKYKSSGKAKDRLSLEDKPGL
jgi:RHS repeat-associated protein